MLVRWIWNWLFNQMWDGLPKKARWALAVLLAGFLIWLFFMPNLHPIPTDTSIEGRSHINRYINHFWVNGQGGGMLAPTVEGESSAVSLSAAIPPRWNGFMGESLRSSSAAMSLKGTVSHCRCPNVAGKTVTCMCTFCPITKSSWAGVKT